MARKDPKIELLRTIPLFERCSDKELKEIASIADEVSIPAGQEIMREGETGIEFVIITEGTVDVIVGGNKMTEFGPGDYVGEMALVTKRPRRATVVATTPVMAFVINHAAFHRVMRDIPGLALNVAQVLAMRLDAVQQFQEGTWVPPESSS